MNRTFGMVLVCRWPPKISHNAVPEILGHVPAIAGDGSRNLILVATQNLTQFFRIQLSRQLGRTDEIAEENAQQSPLRFFLRGDGGWAPVGTFYCRLSKCGHRCHENPAVAERHTKF